MEEPKHPRPWPVSEYLRIPTVDYCITCDKELGKTMEPEDEIGPLHHLSTFPEHIVVSVQGSLSIWRK